MSPIQYHCGLWAYTGCCSFFNFVLVIHVTPDGCLQAQGADHSLQIEFAVRVIIYALFVEVVVVTSIIVGRLLIILAVLAHSTKC